MAIELFVFLSIGYVITEKASWADDSSGFENLKSSRLYLTDVQKITPNNNYKNPIWCPVNPSLIAFVGKEGTFIVSIVDKKISKITDETAGFKFFWTDDGESLIYRTRIQGQATVIKKIKIADGKISILSEGNLSIPLQIKPGIIKYPDETKGEINTLSNNNYKNQELPFVYQQDDKIFLNINGVIKKITEDDGKYFLPNLSPDGSKILYQKISRGIYVTDINSNTTEYIGKGDDASWSPNSNFI